MLTSFSTAISGLSAMSTAIDVVGSNLANLNTTGYKDSTVSFQDMVSQSLNGSDTTQVGLGTSIPQTTRQFSQGSIQSTTGRFDASIQGDGFFMVKDSNDQSLLTRAGNFDEDVDGYLITKSHDRVQGWSATNGVLNTSGPIGDIKLPSGGSLAPQATTQFSLTANLNSSAQAGSSNGQFSTQVQAIDGLGNTIPVTLTFSKDAITPGQWNYMASVPGELVTGGVAGQQQNLLAAPGVIQFDSNGNLATPDAANGNIPIAVTGLADSAPDLNMNWSLYDANAHPLITQYSQTSAVSANTQDGLPAARLMSVTMSNDGKIIAKYSSGVQMVAAQLALATVGNPQTLIAVGNNNLQLGPDSAQTTVGTSGTGGRGSVLGSSLEGSTVDIATEFSNLLIYQRSYQANSRVITVSDELSQETVNLIK